MQHVLRVLSSEGDSRTSWDPARVATGDAEAIAAVREAERIFAEARARGGAAFKVRAGQSATPLDQFDMTAEQIILVPRVVGG